MNINEDSNNNSKDTTNVQEDINAQENVFVREIGIDLKNGQDSRNAVRYMSLGMEFGGSIILFTFGGIFLDRKMGTSPLCTIIGMFLGFFVGMYMIIKVAKNISKEK